jgi:hypothetical protein
MRAFAALTALAAPLGLHSQPAECAVHSGDHAAAAAVAGQLAGQQYNSIILPLYSG